MTCNGRLLILVKRQRTHSSCGAFFMRGMAQGTPFVGKPQPTKARIGLSASSSRTDRAWLGRVVKTFRYGDKCQFSPNPSSKTLPYLIVSVARNPTLTHHRRPERHAVRQPRNYDIKRDPALARWFRPTSRGLSFGLTSRRSETT